MRVASTVLIGLSLAACSFSLDREIDSGDIRGLIVAATADGTTTPAAGAQPAEQVDILFQDRCMVIGSFFDSEAVSPATSIRVLNDGVLIVEMTPLSHPGGGSGEFRVFLPGDGAYTFQPIGSNILVDTQVVVDGCSAARCNGKAATIVGTSGDEVLFGTPGRDGIVGLGGNDRIYGLDGADSLYGGDGRDRIWGGRQADAIIGGENGDKMWGGAGADLVFGETGNDRLIGSTGDDLLNGGRGRVDTLDGRTGSDRCIDSQAGTIRRACEN